MGLLDHVGLKGEDRLDVADHPIGSCVHGRHVTALFEEAVRVLEPVSAMGSQGPEGLRFGVLRVMDFLRRCGCSLSRNLTGHNTYQYLEGVSQSLAAHQISAGDSNISAIYVRST